MASRLLDGREHARGAIAGFSLRPSEICRATEHCLQYMSKALSENVGTQIPSFVTRIPDGSETGKFLTLDLGGTHCRVCAVQLHGNSKYDMMQSKHVIPQDVMVNPSHKPLFDYLAAKIATFLKENPSMDVEDHHPAQDSSPGRFRKLGFTFSFTYDSHSASHGTMLQWDKGWDIPDAIGRDPCRMLQEAIDRLGLRVHVAALTNDSVGTLMAKAYTSSSFTPLIGAIFGTGTNAAYIENIAKIKKLSHEPRKGTDAIMVVNTEWGAWFDGSPSALPTCIYDEILDRESLSPGEQLFEKRTSALYLGELSRLAIKDLAICKRLDMTIRPGSPLQRSYSLNSSFLSTLATEYEGAKGASLYKVKDEISKTLHATDVSTRDAHALSRLGAAIVRRAAELAGAAIAAIIIHSGKLKLEPGSRSADRVSKGADRSCWEILSAAVSRLWKRLDEDDAATFGSESTVKSAGEGIDIGIDGSLFEYYPRFEQHIRSSLRVIPGIGLEGEVRIKIGLAKDGPSLGAALIAQSIQ